MKHIYLKNINIIYQSVRRIGALTGWKRNALAFVFGVCATFTLAPFFIFPLIIPAFTGLFLLINAAPSLRRAFWDGWWWGWGFYISGLYWFCIALLTDAEHFAWLIPFALFGLTGVIAIYSGLACLITSLLFPSPLVGEGQGEGAGATCSKFGCVESSPPPGASRHPPPQGGRGFLKIFLFSVVWTCVEYARGHLFSGFPWNLAGYSFGFSDASLQLASLVGVYGLTWFAVLLGSSFAALYPFSLPPCGGGRGGGNLSTKSGIEYVEPFPPPLPSPTRGEGIIFVFIIWSLFALGTGWGAWRLQMADQIPESERYVPGVMLRLVQANISQPHKWDPKLERQGVREQIRLTESPGLEKVTHIIWPETAVPYAIEAGSPLARQLGDSIPDGKVLITGALRISPVSREAAQDPALANAPQDLDFQVWNSLVAIDHDGGIVGSYDKSKLVPFGEFLPFRSVIPKAWLTPVGEKDFSRGIGVQTLEWPGLPPLSPLICYEVIFPDSVIDQLHFPQLLLNVTNDAWFGMASGPYQHFEMSRMRAVEEGIPLVRVANTGVTAIVDSYGRIVGALPLGTQGIIDHKLPKAQKEYTIYNRYNNTIIQSLLLSALLLILYQKRKGKN